jgi:two-component system response regulator RpfG
MYDIKHALNVSRLSRDIGKQIGMDAKNQTLLYSAGLFHDIGKMLVPKDLLEKPSSLTSDEYIIVQWHTTLGHKILSQIPDEFHIAAAKAALYHHERLDGSGYLGLKGEQIPKEARIIAVADVFDALMSDRPYRKKWDLATAIRHIQDNSGILFDAEVVDALSRLYIFH